MSTSDKTDFVIEEFYNNLENVLPLTKKGELTMIIGDSNAKVGSGREAVCVGRYGLGEKKH